MQMVNSFCFEQRTKTKIRAGFILGVCYVMHTPGVLVYLSVNVSIIWCGIFLRNIILNSHMMQILNQDETPLLYSLVFGEGVVNDATAVVLFNAVHNFDLTNIDGITALQLFGNFVYLFFTSTGLGVAVSKSS